MSKYRSALPQLNGGLFLADGGPETDIIFNRGVPIREFALHTLLASPEHREVVADYFRGYLKLAKTSGTGIILDSTTWRAQMNWAEALETSEDELRKINLESIAFTVALKNEFSESEHPIVINAPIGPREDAYSAAKDIAADEAERYHAKQIGWLKDTAVDMITALTFNSSVEATGIVRAANAAGIPIVVSLITETDGKLPTGQSIRDAIRAIDADAGEGAAYFMVNCAHADHFFEELTGEDWTRRIRGVRCNASRLSHAELDACEVLDDGNPMEMGADYRKLRDRMPWLNVFGGCCGSDLRHVTAIANALTA